METVSKHAGDGHATFPTHRGPCPRRGSPAPLSTHHIDIADDTKQAARARRYDIAPLDDTRSGAGGEARQSDKEGEAINTAVSREKRGRMMNG